MPILIVLAVTPGAVPARRTLPPLDRGGLPTGELSLPLVPAPTDLPSVLPGDRLASPPATGAAEIGDCGLTCPLVTPDSGPASCEPTCVRCCAVLPHAGSTTAVATTATARQG